MILSIKHYQGLMWVFIILFMTAVTLLCRRIEQVKKLRKELEEVRK